MNKTFKLIDCHTHALEHGVNKEIKVDEMIQSATHKGLEGITLTDHLPLPPGFIDPVPEKDCSMSADKYIEYQKLVKKAVLKYQSQIKVFRGAEVDYLPEYLNWTKTELAKLNLDYAIGSDHFIGTDSNGVNLILDHGKASFENCLEIYGGIKNLAAEYFKRARDMVKTGIFDSIGHLDVLKKYNISNEYFSGNENWYKEEVLKTLDILKEYNLALELNSSGFIKYGEQYPSLWILKEAKKRNVPIILGSDAHLPELIGSNFDQAVQIAKEAGYQAISYFINRKWQEVKI